MSTHPSSRQEAPQHQAMRQKNLRLALILASVAAVFFIGFMAKMVLLGQP